MNLVNNIPTKYLGPLLILLGLLPLLVYATQIRQLLFPKAANTTNELIPISPILPPTHFTDIDENGWAWKYIQQIVELGIIPPTSPTTFNPAGTIKRADMAEFLAKAYEIATNQNASTSATPFVDVGHLPSSQQEAIGKIYGLGITAGTSATTFSPDMEINRAQMATFLSNLYKAVTGNFAPEVTTPFTDIGGSDITWAQKPVARIYGLGITAGISPTEFGPYLTVTREQMATFIYNFLRLFPHSRNNPELSEEIHQIRSITFYETFQGPPSQYVARIPSELDLIKDAGFNTIWLVLPWKFLNPKPLATPPEYNDTEFTALINILEQLKSRNMKAIIGLNYLGNNWSPEGIDYCTWLTNPLSYSAFERYSAEFLSRISNYNNTTYILFFTENSEPCGLDSYGQAKLHAYYLRHSLGSLPSRLPKDLREKFKIGYHDYSLVNLDWAKGESPILLPNSFDFVSMVLYGQEGKNETEISNELNTRTERFRRLFPKMPLLVGETGITNCFNRNGSPTIQAKGLTNILSLAKKNNLGFNLWGWRDGPCTINPNNDNAGLGLIMRYSFEERIPEDRLRLSGFYVKALLNPIPLTDVDENGWSWKYIQRIIPTKIMPPPTLSEFDPQRSVRRVDMAEFLAKTYDFISDYLLRSDTTTPVVSTPFTDIGYLSPSQQEAIGKIYGLGITTDSPSTVFSPEAEINRAQMATFLSNLYKAVTGDFAPVVSTPFIDINNNQDIARIYGLGITAGVSISPPSFGPNLIVTREQMATFIMNLIEKLFSAPLTLAPLAPPITPTTTSNPPDAPLQTTPTPVSSTQPTEITTQSLSLPSSRTTPSTIVDTTPTIPAPTPTPTPQFAPATLVTLQEEASPSTPNIFTQIIETVTRVVEQTIETIFPGN